MYLVTPDSAITRQKERILTTKTVKQGNGNIYGEIEQALEFMSSGIIIIKWRVLNHPTYLTRID